MYTSLRIDQACFFFYFDPVSDKKAFEHMILFYFSCAFLIIGIILRADADLFKSIYPIRNNKTKKPTQNGMAKYFAHNQMCRP